MSTASRIGDTERAIIRACIKAMHCPRNRFGKLDPSLLSGNTGPEEMHEMMKVHGFDKQLPHGGYDVVDKACMILQAMIGDEPKSIMDY